MNKRYLILALLSVAIGAGMLLMPENSRVKEINPDQLLNAIDDPSRFLSTDLITDRLVKKDPSLLLIDVRPAAQFKTFAIPGAVNIPLDSLLTESSIEMIGKKELDKVFCSNSDLMSDQAWILSKRSGFEPIFVLEGGVNKWFNDIVEAKEPAAFESSEMLALYQFRKAASQHFFGSPEVKSEVAVAPKKTTPVQKKPVEASTGGGC
ncbi:MAG: rhodanese-like domain-containing protein [Bacteroidales bacterium]|jgi:rhodanese-related sulfurtransferase|nr:rhodanese-like domain-containing protein [Bacteroidales bacterium]